MFYYPGTQDLSVGSSCSCADMTLCSADAAAPEQTLPPAAAVCVVTAGASGGCAELEFSGPAYAIPHTNESSPQSTVA